MNYIDSFSTRIAINGELRWVVSQNDYVDAIVALHKCARAIDALTEALGDGPGYEAREEAAEARAETKAVLGHIPPTLFHTEMS